MSESFEQVTELARAFAASAPKIDGAEQIAISLYHLLAAGSPVAIDRLAEAAGTGIDDTARTLSAWPGVYFDDRGAVIGFWGLAVEPMPHRLNVDGRTLYTWCAWDGLFIPEILGVSANFCTQCPVKTTHDRIANRKSQSHSFGFSHLFGREKRIENLVGIRNADTCVPYAERHLSPLPLNSELKPLVIHRCHGLNCIRD